MFDLVLPGVSSGCSEVMTVGRAKTQSKDLLSWGATWDLPSEMGKLGRAADSLWYSWASFHGNSLPNFITLIAQKIRPCLFSSILLLLTRRCLPKDKLHLQFAALDPSQFSCVLEILGQWIQPRWLSEEGMSARNCVTSVQTFALFSQGYRSVPC